MPTTKIDERQPYGRVSGPPLPGTDRPPAFEQRGRLFDIHKRLIEPGVPLDPQEVAEDEASAKAEVDAHALAREEAETWAQRREDAQVRAREREKHMALNRTRASSPSRITPSYHPDEFDRPAHYQLGEKYLDEHGREIVPGRPMTAEALTAAKALEEDTEGLLVTALIAQAHTLSFNALLAAARAMLGPTCPRSLEQIVEKLRLLVKRDPSLRVPRIREGACPR
jgi:hypothetical protein